VKNQIMNALLLGLLSLLPLLEGCAVAPDAPLAMSSVDQALQELADDVAQDEALAQQRAAAVAQLLQELAPAVEQASDTEARFDLSVNGVSSHDFFRGLVKDTGYNMVVHPDVDGLITLDLKDVSVVQVMEIMRDVYGYDYVRSGDLYQVYPDVLRTEIFQINYLNVERSGRSEMQVSAGKVSDAGSSGGSSNGQNGMGQNGSGDQQSRGGGNVVGTIVNTDAQTDFWHELEDTLKSLTSGDSGSQVVVTPQVGLVVVRAFPESMHAVRDYLKRVEATLHRQVILEAKIVEVTLREGFQAGINWNTFGDASGGTFKPRSVVDENGVVTVTGGSEHSTAGELIAGAGDFFNPLGSGFTLSASYGDFEGAIELLQTQGDVQVLSSPRIATVNNQKAVIKVGSDEFFVTDISTNTITAGSAINTSDSPELTPFFSGIALDVTPQISEDGDVILHIHPTVSQVDEQLKTISGESVPLAASTIRESDSIVRAHNRQIVVIGGLMQNTSDNKGAHVPWLGRIPGFGHLFRQRLNSSIKSELVILLKPIVVEDQSQSQAIGQSMSRIEALRQLLKQGG
jgi:MSHA biogenesis protein MshL